MKVYTQYVVLATDVMDKELGQLRKKRWELAFNVECGDETKPCNEMTNRRATVVVEYLIQSSDVSHTMQHWQIYTLERKVLPGMLPGL